MWGREANHSYYLLFHFGKIIPILPRGQEDQSFEKPKLRCRPVFAAPPRLQLPAEVRAVAKPVSSAATPDASVDGPTWHHHSLSADKVIRCPAAELDERIKRRDRENHRPYPLDLGGAWIDDLSQVTRILVGLPHDRVSANPEGIRGGLPDPQGRGDDRHADHPRGAGAQRAKQHVRSRHAAR
jgi:hypothetical protein